MQEKNMGHICPIGRSGVKIPRAARNEIIKPKVDLWITVLLCSCKIIAVFYSCKLF